MGRLRLGGYLLSLRKLVKMSEEQEDFPAHECDRQDGIIRDMIMEQCDTFSCKAYQDVDIPQCMRNYASYALDQMYKRIQTKDEKYNKWLEEMFNDFKIDFNII